MVERSGGAGAARLDVLQRLLEGEGHAAADDELVNLVNHILDQLDLVGHFGPAQDRQEWSHRRLDSLAHAINNQCLHWMRPTLAK